MQVALVQFDIAWEQRDTNHAKVRSLLDHAKPQAGSLIVLPEMFATGFSMNVPAIVDADRATEQFLQQIAKQHRAFVLAGIVQPGSKENLGRNCAMVIGPEGLENSSYCKLHPFSMGGEHRHFEAGKHIAAFECADFTITPLVCYDLRFPEVFRVATGIGANVFCVIANWPRARIQHWVTLLQARAIENQAYVIGVNRVGNDPGLEYPGRSMVVDPMGQIIADAGDRECVLFAELQVAAVHEIRAKLPFLRDMRRDLLPNYFPNRNSNT